MKIVALAGGVGGAKMADGFAQNLSPEELTLIVNTGDDFEHIGLYISPDLDTVCYTLAGLVNRTTGWGRHEESFRLLDALGVLGGETWFKLGDKDLATHLERTRRLRDGEKLSDITLSFCRTWGVRHNVLPMSDDPVRTMVDTVQYGELSFQEYFVHRKCEPKVKGFRFAGTESARAAPGVLEAIEAADAMVVCPSNPWVSIDPILAVTGIRRGVCRKKLVAISPIISGKTVKGPAAQMFTDLGFKSSAVAVADHYHQLLAGFVMDSVDTGSAQELSIPVLATNTLMKTKTDRIRLAEDVLNFIQTL